MSKDHGKFQDPFKFAEKIFFMTRQV